MYVLGNHLALAGCLSLLGIAALNDAAHSQNREVFRMTGSKSLIFECEDEKFMKCGKPAPYADEVRRSITVERDTVTLSESGFRVRCGSPARRTRFEGRYRGNDGRGTAQCLATVSPEEINIQL